MPTGIRHVEIKTESLPRELGQVSPISQQLNIWGDPNFSKTGSIEYLGKSEFGEYDKFRITYSVIQKIIGYYHSEKIENLLVDVQNYLYLSKDKKYMLIKAPRRDVDKILNLLSRENLIEYNERELDLKVFKEKLSVDKGKIKAVVGAWFTNVESINVNTIAIFGTEIDQSEEFDDYASQDSSKISELIVDFGEETIAITNKYGAIFYNRRTEEKVLEGYSIVKDLLSGFDMFN